MNDQERGRLAVLVAECRRKAKKARDKATDYHRDNRPDSAWRVTRKAEFFDELAARLDGSYVRPETEIERMKRVGEGRSLHEAALRDDETRFNMLPRER